MTSEILFGLFNIGFAIALYMRINRAVKDKQMQFTQIYGPVTKVEKIVIKGKGLTVAMTGFGISAILFAFSGLSAIFSYTNMGTHLLITFGSGILFVITMAVASYISTHSQK